MQPSGVVRCRTNSEKYSIWKLLYGICIRALTFELWRAQRQAAFEKDLLRPMTGIHSEKYTPRCISIVNVPGH